MKRDKINTLKKRCKKDMLSKVKTGAILTGTMLMTATPVFAQSFTAYNGTNANNIMNGVKSLFGTIGTYGGGLYAIVAIFTLILALRNEDNEGRNKALLNLLAAIALLSTGVIINLFFS